MVHRPQDLLYSVYALRDPLSGLVGYVGISSAPRRRLTAHLKPSRYNLQRNDWILDLQRRGLKPALDILRKGLPLEEAQNVEACWIHRYWACGMPLTNVMGATKMYSRNIARYLEHSWS